jgi:nucleotide-binding universal stress UspA family protein
MIRTIVVPLDGSKFGEQAVAPAVQIAERAGAQLHFVHVLVPLVVGDPMMQYAMLDVETPEQARDYLAKLLQRVDAGRLKQAPVANVLEGPVTDALQHYAVTHRADLIVMTTHGRGPLSRAWLGSVTDELIRSVTTPILLFRAQEDAAAGPATAFRKVLIAVNGTPDSEAVLTPAMELARLFGAPITLVRAIPPRKTVETTTQPPPVTEIHLGERPGSTPEAELDRLMSMLRGHRIEVESRIVEHDRPEVAILEEAKRLGCDLIALETHGRSGLARLFAGSVTDKVIRGSECPVLVHRTEHHAKESS